MSLSDEINKSLREESEYFARHQDESNTIDSWEDTGEVDQEKCKLRTLDCPVCTIEAFKCPECGAGLNKEYSCRPCGVNWEEFIND